MSARPIYKRITSIPDGSLHYDVNGWLEKLKLSIPRAAYLDLMTAIDKLGYYENCTEASAAAFQREYYCVPMSTVDQGE